MSAGILKTIVIVLAVLIFLAFGLIVWRIFGIVGGAAPTLGEVSLDLPDGCRIVGAEALGDQLAVLTDGPGCNAVHIVDPATGETAGRITP